MNKKINEISFLFILVLIYSITVLNKNTYSQSKKQIELELIREMRFEGKYPGSIRQISVLSEDDIERIRKEEKLKNDEDIFPVRAVNFDTKDDIVLYDTKGNVSKIKKIEHTFTFLSDDGEYFAVGETDVLDREGKLKWRVEKPEQDTNRPRRKRNVFILSNDGRGVVTNKRLPTEIGRGWFKDLSFYDDRGNLLKHIDVEIKEMPAVFRDVRQILQFSDDSKIFVAWINGELVAYDKKGDELWRYRIDGVRIDKLKISPKGKYIAVSVAIRISGGVGSKNTIYLLDNSGRFIGSYNVLPGEIKLSFSPDSKYLGIADYHNIYLLETKNGNLLWKYSFGQIFRPNSVSISGDYISAGVSTYLKEGERGSKRYVYIFNISGEVILIKELEGNHIGFIKTSIIGKKYLSVSSADIIMVFRIKEK